MLESLLAIFPGMDVDVVREVLQACNGDVNHASEMLADMLAPHPARGPDQAPTPAPVAPPAPAPIPVPEPEPVPEAKEEAKPSPKIDESKIVTQAETTNDNGTNDEAEVEAEAEDELEFEAEIDQPEVEVEVTNADDDADDPEVQNQHKKPAGASGSLAEKVEQVLQLMPGADVANVERVLRACRGDVVRATEILMGDSELQPGASQAHSDLPDEDDDGSFHPVQSGISTGSGENWIDELCYKAGEKEEVKIGMSPEEYKQYENALGRISRMLQEDTAFRQHAEFQKSLGPQSGRGLQASETAGFLRGADAHAGKCFELMLQRERLHCGEFVVLYHSYSIAALLYEVNACIARVIYGLPEDFASLPRLLKKPFDKRPCMTLLLDDFKSFGGQDHNPEFRQLAISTSVSLFATGSEAPPVQVFNQGYSCSDLSFTEVLSNILRSVGATAAEALDMVAKMVKLGGEWGLPVANYGQAASGTSAPSGHMIQIFLHSKYIDDAAYASHAYGVHDPARHPLSTYLTASARCDGQARVFCHPTLFTDLGKAKIYHYSANKRFNDNRVEFQKALQRVLAPVLGTNAAIYRAYCGVEGLEN
eukprot:TRINITY_DN3821_c0_g1_i1.p1 TRINITY_DN3821_c0_g1~~TRINITY_DN3821_c0_g1_i1.p1  ORF type:complete len:593 (+),score=101.44 TRINITY_DN3821_c0_g1_i1:32-1810(+)